MAFRKQRRTVVPMEVEQHELDDLLAEYADEEIFGTALQDDDAEPTLDDSRFAGGFRAKLVLEPRSYQQDAIDRWVENEGRGLVVLPTGAGKTVVALMTIERTRLRTLVVVSTLR